MSSLAGQTVNRFGLDQTEQIDYKFNSQGFRSNTDFDFVPDYAVFGCSLVFGIGVPVENIFASCLPNSHNYGLAGVYNNQEIFSTINNFINSDLYSTQTQIAVVWTDRNTEQLPGYYKKLIPYNVTHFFCSSPLPLADCYAMIPQLDTDKSSTHMGVNTHQFFGRILLKLFNQ
jgi:hypothetical protein